MPGESNADFEAMFLARRRLTKSLRYSFASIFLVSYNIAVSWDIEVTDEFERWWDTLDEGEREDVRSVVGLLEEKGPTLPFPHSSGVVSSKHARMRELRIQHEGGPYRVLYAFDPRRTAILLIGGDKTGNDRWYEENVPIADRLYDAHLQELERIAIQNQRREDNRERDRGKKQ